MTVVFFPVFVQSAASCRWSFENASQRGDENPGDSDRGRFPEEVLAQGMPWRSGPIDVQ
jgi:hypothetical protein